MRYAPFIVLLIVLFPGGTSPAASVLFDFETSQDLAGWSNRDRLALSSDFVTSGKRCAVLDAPEWKPGMDQWPIWDTTNLPVRDWSGFDRLMIDFTNPSDTAELIRGRVADEPTSRKPSTLWPVWTQTIPARSHLRAVIPLDKFLGTAIDRTKVARFLLYTARATPNYRVHLDNVMLLAPGDQPPPLPAEYVRQIVQLRIRSKSLGQAGKAIDAARQAAEQAEQPSVRAWGEASLKEIQAALDALLNKADQPAIRIEQVHEIGDEVDLIAHRAARLETLIRARAAFAAISPTSQYAVGWASTMDKVLPRDMPLPMVQISAVRELSVARNESEGVQVVVIPFDAPLQGVRVEVGALAAADGSALPSGAVDVRTVGYVKTRRPDYDVDYVGWWPDPLIDFLPEVKIEPGDAQSFWVRLRPGKDARPGVYEGPVRVVAAGAAPAELKLRVRIRDFAMPDASPIPIATMDPDRGFFEKYKPESWDTFKLKLADFMADYYIDYDEIYRAGPPDFDILRRLRDQGRLRAFNLCTLKDSIFVPDMTDAQYEQALATLISQIQSGYDRAKAEGMLQFAYLYGMDEVPPAAFPILKRLTDDLKKRFPEVPIMTTAQDYDYGQASGADNVDVWVPIINEYKPDLAAKARAAGRKVWWYICQSPAHPYPNVFTEYPAIELRLLMGAMTAKYQPDGFLYYCTFRDLIYDEPPRKPVDRGPFTEWNPRAFVEPFNGEGYLFYPGPNGRPLASIRVENFRDGLEDYVYWKLLRDQVRTADPARDRAWLIEARKALNVPERLVKSAHEFSTDPSVLYGYRQTLADLIERANADRRGK